MRIPQTTPLPQLTLPFHKICPSTMAVIFTGGENQSPTYQEDQSGEQPHLKVVG